MHPVLEVLPEPGGPARAARDHPVTGKGLRP